MPEHSEDRRRGWIPAPEELYDVPIMKDYEPDGDVNPGQSVEPPLYELPERESYDAMSKVDQQHELVTMLVLDWLVVNGWTDAMLAPTRLTALDQLEAMKLIEYVTHVVLDQHEVPVDLWFEVLLTESVTVATLCDLLDNADANAKVPLPGEPGHHNAVLDAIEATRAALASFDDAG